MASRKLLAPRTAVYQDGRGSEPMIDVGSVFPADALNIFLRPSKREHIDYGARIGVFEYRRLGGGLPFRAGRDGDVLLAVDRVADRRRHHAATGIEAPQLFQSLAVIGDERALPQ